MARMGHEVIIVGRDREKGMRAADELRSTTDNGKISFLAADLSLVSDVRQLAEQVLGLCSELHYLVHSAGIVRGRRTLTAEGIESNFATNYLSRFALTLQLLSLLDAAGTPEIAARVLLVGGAARTGRIYFDDVNLSKNFNTLRAVGQFCQANDVFAVELTRRLAATHQKPRITITCLKIGVVKTNIRREFPTWMKWLVPLVFDPLLSQTPEQAADSALRLLLSQKFEGISGALFLKIRKFRRIKRDLQLDREQGRRLWRLSQELSYQASQPAVAVGAHVSTART